MTWTQTYEQLHQRTSGVQDAARAREDLLRRSGLLADDGLRRQLDAFAARVAGAARTPLAMVNLIGGCEQRFVGLHVGDARAAGVVGRTMSLEDGYCPTVLTTRKALSLPDVCIAWHFASNRVLDRLGVRAYFGAPLITSTGIAIGTVCAVGLGEPREREQARPMHELMTGFGAEVMGLIGPRLEVR